MTETDAQRARPVIKSVAFSAVEWATVERRLTLAQARSFGEFARSAILDQKIIVRQIAFDPKVIGAELSRIGNNINQIARQVNTDDVVTVAEMRATRVLVSEIQQLIERAVKEAE